MRGTRRSKKVILRININQKLPLLKGMLLKKLLSFVLSTLKQFNMLGFVTKIHVIQDC